MDEEQNKRFPSVLFSFARHEWTDILPKSVLTSRSKPYFQDPSSQLDENIRETFLGSSHLEIASLEYLEQMRTSAFAPARFLDLNDFPSEIKEYFDRFYTEQENEDVLYEIANSVAEWLIDAPNEYQTLLAEYLRSIPLKGCQILIAALSDASFSSSNSILLKSVSLFLKSTDKRLAQTTATFLLMCGGIEGSDLLEQMLNTEELPHSRLIQGIRKLLS